VPAAERDGGADERDGTVKDPVTGRLLPPVVALVRETCRRLAEQEDVFVERLGLSLVELGPATSRGPARLEVVPEVVRSLLWAALAGEPEARVELHLREFGWSHGVRGLPPGEYQALGQALLRTLRRAAPDGWDSWTSSAWVSYYLWLSRHLAAGAEAGRREADARAAASGVRPGLAEDAGVPVGSAASGAAGGQSRAGTSRTVGIPSGIGALPLRPGEIVLS
jgi:hypothetical protein